MNDTEKDKQGRVMYFHEGYADKIKTHYKEMGKAERCAAKYILEHGAECVEMSIQALAEHSGCSTASIVRLCKNLGYSGFAELKFQIQQNNTGFTKDNLSISHRDSPMSMKQKTLQFAQYSLNAMVRDLDDKALDQASELLAKANRILFCAMGSACGAALAGANHLLSAGLDASFMMDDLLQMRTVSYFKPGDVVIGINYDGYAKAVADTMMVAKSVGATTILITSFPDGLISKYADLVLETPHRNANNALNFSTTTMCQMMIVQLMIVGVWQRTGGQLDKKSSQVRNYTQLKRYSPDIAELEITLAKQ